MKKATIRTHEQFVNFIMEDERFYETIKDSFAKNFFRYMEIVPLIQCDKKAAEYVWDDLMDNAWSETDDVIFKNSKKKAVEWLADKFKMTMAFIQED